MRKDLLGIKDSQLKEDADLTTSNIEGETSLLFGSQSDSSQGKQGALFDEWSNVDTFYIEFLSLQR
jgi:hypothetical protein